MTMYRDIHQFHQKFGLAHRDGPRRLMGSFDNLSQFEAGLRYALASLHSPQDDLLHFRIKFMIEELAEYVEGAREMDLEKQLDALVDLVYVALGTAYLHGFNFEEAWHRVHNANMEKVKGTAESSKRNSDYDVVKPEGWHPPDLDDLVLIASMPCGDCGTEMEGTLSCCFCETYLCFGCVTPVLHANLCRACVQAVNLTALNEEDSE